MKTEDFLLGYWVYKNVLHNEKNDPESDNYGEEYNDYESEEREQEIEEIMDEYGVDEDEAEEILDSM